jgi:hypothetical protein
LEVLRRDPSLIDAWYAYSGDQRVSDGWWFDEEPAGTYVIGTINDSEREAFSDRAVASANFIVKHLAPLVDERWWERIINTWRAR